MASWSAVAAEAPELADRVRATFAGRKHATLATLTRDGSPRISGTEVEFGADGEIYLGMMDGSLKAKDLRRDPRFALHCPTVDPAEDDPTDWPGEGKLSGVAVEVDPPADAEAPQHRFRLDVTGVVHTRVAESGEHLVIEHWHAGRGVAQLERR